MAEDSGQIPSGPEPLRHWPNPPALRRAGEGRVGTATPFWMDSDSHFIKKPLLILLPYLRREWACQRGRRRRC